MTDAIRTAIVPATASAVFFRIFLARGFIVFFLRPPKWNGLRPFVTRGECTFFAVPKSRRIC